MLGERVRVCLCAELAQEPRRSLNVREEEGDGAGREIGSHARVIIRRGAICASSYTYPLPLALAFGRWGLVAG